MRGLSGALGRIGALRAALPPAARKAVKDAAAAALDSARETVPVDTGRLRDSLRAETKQLTGTVSTSCGYASAVENLSPFLAPAAKRADLTKRCAQALKEVLHD